MLICGALQADKAPLCVRLLSMSPSSEQKAVQEELMQAATALSRAAPLPEPLPDLKLQNGNLDALRMLWVQVRPTHFCDERTKIFHRPFA